MPCSTVWANDAFDFVLAYLFGIIFQYFSVAPMRAFEVGMFVWMRFAHKFLFADLKPTSGLYWFVMQIAMIVGFATTYPANWWLIRKGVKEAS